MEPEVDDLFWRTLYWMHETIRTSSPMPTDGRHLAAFATYNHIPLTYDAKVIGVAANSVMFRNVMTRLGKFEWKRRALRFLSEQILDKTNREYIIIAGILEDFPPTARDDVRLALLRFVVKWQQGPMPENPLRYAVLIMPTGIIRCFNEPGPGKVIHNQWP